MGVKTGSEMTTREDGAMSRFYGSIQGGRGEATRQGHTASGIIGHIRGWRSGVRVRGYDDDGRDVFDIHVTAGSSGAAPDEYVGTVVLDVDGRPLLHHGSPAPK